MDRVQHARFTIGEERVSGEKVRRPQGQSTGPPRITECGEDGVIEDARVVLNDETAAFN